MYINYIYVYKLYNMYIYIYHFLLQMINFLLLDRFIDNPNDPVSGLVV